MHTAHFQRFQQPQAGRPPSRSWDGKQRRVELERSCAERQRLETGGRLQDLKAPIAGAGRPTAPIELENSVSTPCMPPQRKRPSIDSIGLPVGWCVTMRRGVASPPAAACGRWIVNPTPLSTIAGLRKRVPAIAPPLALLPGCGGRWGACIDTRCASVPNSRLPDRLGRVRALP